MDYTIFERENTLRQNVNEIKDTDLIHWKPELYNSTRVEVPNDEHILVPSEITGFVAKRDLNRRIQEFTGGLLNFIDWNNVALAGGSVSNMINANCNPDNDLVDLDLFIHGLNPDEARNKIYELVGDIRDAMSRYMQCRFTAVKNKYVLSLIPNKVEYRVLKVQIMFRIYNSIHEILAGFDVDSCCVAYDGKNVYLTERSLNAFNTGYNVVDMGRRSPSYEHRLCKYSKRGFGVYVPFEYRSKYNKMFFLNRYVKGLERLLYITKFNRRDEFMSFLAMVTRRLSIRFRGGASSSYDQQAVALEDTKTRDIRSFIAKFNRGVSDEFRYDIIEFSFKPAVAVPARDESDSESADDSTEATGSANPLADVEFMVTNPGQQLTGSFNPITKEDWINPDYTAENVDHLGRSLDLLAIRSGKLDTKHLHGKFVFDNSLFGPIEYSIIYGRGDTDKVTDTWDNRHKFKGVFNLYKIDPMILSVLVGRTDMVDHILNKDTETYTKENMTKFFPTLIKIAIMMDDLQMVKTLTKYFNKNNKHEFDVWFYRETVERFNAREIVKYFCLKIESGVERESEIDKLLRLSEREIQHTLILDNLNGYNTYADKSLFRKKFPFHTFSDDVLRLLVSAASDIATLVAHATELVPKKVVEKHRPTFTSSFDEDYYNWKHQQAISLYDTSRNNEVGAWALRMLQVYVPERVEKTSKANPLEYVFENPLTSTVVNTATLSIMKMLHDGTLTKKLVNEYGCTDWNSTTLAPLWDYVVYRDTPEDLSIFIPTTQAQRKFLQYRKAALSANLRALLVKLKTEVLDLKHDVLYVKYANEFKNTADHLSVLDTGSLPSDYVRSENVFGITPCDYVINQILHMWKLHIDPLDLEADPSAPAQTCQSRRTRYRDRFSKQVAEPAESSDEETGTDAQNKKRDVDLKRLTNLRESLRKIRWADPIVPADMSAMSDMRLAEILEMI